MNYILWREIGEEMIIKTWMGIYDRMNDFIEAKGCLKNN